MIDKDKHFYPVSMVAEILGISADRLRTYEEEGLIKPFRQESKSTKIKGRKRLYSGNDIEWLEKIRQLLQLGINTPSIRLILQLLPYIRKSDLKDIVINKLNDQDKVSEQWELFKELYQHPVYKQISTK